MSDLNLSQEEQKELMKEAFKEAYKEFMDERFAQFGRWALGTFLAMVMGALTYFILMINGWKAPQ